jgi:hypothetical protein
MRGGGAELGLPLLPGTAATDAPQAPADGASPWRLAGRFLGILVVPAVILMLAQERPGGGVDGVSPHGGLALDLLAGGDGGRRVYTVPRGCLFAALVGAGVGVAGVVLAGPILAYFGFTAAGVSAGSLAAMWQSTMGGVIASGGLFAMLQSVAAAGFGFAGAVTLTGATATAFAAFCKLADKSCHGCIGH